ncbi:MAG TPA: translational GTPase TypA [Candidatus Gracilibacteria bacterium]|nr:translational GTPase TypA [Candidatus Gracilibacteria bacterium]
MNKIINIAIIAHVDHGKTTLTDHLLRQGGAFNSHEKVEELVMDSNPLERERGITILAKNSAIHYKDFKINIVDTPGHADFSSEVERVLKMADTVLLLVDAKEGPMPQTKFVLQKSLNLGLRPIVIINKIDRKDQRANEVVNMVFDLFVKLGANDKQLDFPILYAIAREGMAKLRMEDEGKDLTPLFETIIKHVKPYPDLSADPLQMQVTNLTYDDYIGRIAIGRVTKGTFKMGQQIAVCKRDGSVKPAKITKLYNFEGLKQVEIQEATCGDIVAVAGIPDVTIGETITDPQNPQPMPLLEIDEPTLSMDFLVNNSPFAGKEGKFVTTRHIRDRLEKELQTNVGLKIEPIPNSDGYKVSGRGELHLSILLENMRREGYEVQVSQPEVILKNINGEKMEPVEQLVINVPDEYAGIAIEKLGTRRAEMQNMKSENGSTTMEFTIPTRGLLGFRSEFIMDTRGKGIMYHSFYRYERFKGNLTRRQNGVLISDSTGVSVAYALWSLQERGRLFIGPVTSVYEGMILGENARSEDINVNPTKEKKLSNMRTTSSDEAIRLTPHLELTLEQALEFIETDELVEITPKSIRLRKKFLTDNERRRNRRGLEPTVG